MSAANEKSVLVTFKGAECKKFLKLFKLSEVRTMSEFVRQCVLKDAK